MKKRKVGRRRWVGNVVRVNDSGWWQKLDGVEKVLGKRKKGLGE